MPYKSEPKYRISISIYDDEASESVVIMDEPMMSSEEDNVATFYRALKQFTDKKEGHEATYYPKGDETV